MAFVISCASAVACTIFARRWAEVMDVVTAPARSISMAITTSSSTMVKPPRAARKQRLLLFRLFIMHPSPFD